MRGGSRDSPPSGEVGSKPVALEGIVTVLEKSVSSFSKTAFVYGGSRLSKVLRGWARGCAEGRLTLQNHHRVARRDPGSSGPVVDRA